MKKAFLSIAFVAGFAAWTVYLHNKPASNDFGMLSAQTTQSSVGAFTPPSFDMPITSKPAVSTAGVSTASSKQAVLVKTGKYRNGTYTGSVADAYYGNLQVLAVINNGQLADVQFLQYPNDRSTSRRIALYALPRLRQEAIQSQSATVSTISGATDDSGAFRTSLSSALAQAKRG